MDKEADDKLREFAKEFITERNRLLACGDTEEFQNYFALFFDVFIVTSPKVEALHLSDEEKAKWRQEVAEMARDYAVKHGPDA